MEEELAGEGFARVDLLTPVDIEELRRLHADLHPRSGVDFDTDFSYLSPSHKRVVDRGIREVIAPRLEEKLEPFRLFNVSFVVKWPGGGSRVPLHQDWSYLDERADRSLTIWIPLDDTSPEAGNGPLGFIPRSHRLPAFMRGASSVPWYLPYREALESRLEHVGVPAGQALIFDGRILHGSPANASGRPRRAIAAMVAPADSVLRYHDYRDGRFDVYEVDEEFFLENGPLDLRARMPSGIRLLESVPSPEAAPAPLEELERECGISLDPVPAASIPDLYLMGLPVGGSQADPPEGIVSKRLALSFHDAVESRCPDPLVTASSFPELGAVEDATRSLGSDPIWRPESLDEEAKDLPVRAGRCLVRDLWSDVSAEPSLKDLVRRTRAEGIWAISLAPRTELRPRRCGESSTLLVVAPLESPHPDGTGALQVGDRVEALRAGRALAFDPTWEHGGWNFGTDEVTLLCLAVPRALPATLSFARRLLRRCGVLGQPSLRDS